MNGKEVQVLTSMTDPLRFPATDIVDLYSHRWEIELSYWEIKHSLLGNRLTLRSRTPEMVFQELYNLIRFQMARMAYSLDAVHPNQLSFHQAAHWFIKELTILPWGSPGRVPGVLQSMLDMAPAFVLPERRERSYPRSVRRRPQKYPTKKIQVSVNRMALLPTVGFLVPERLKTLTITLRSANGGSAGNQQSQQQQATLTRP